MRKISPKKYAISLYESLQGIEKREIPEVIKSFVALLARNKDLKKADKIVKAFRDYINEQERILEVLAISAEPLDSQFKEEIIDYLESSLNKEIELKEQTDKNLVGGVILKYGDVVVDGSVKKRIELLADSLK